MITDFIMWEKFHIGMTYKGVTQRCLIEIQEFVPKEYFFIKADTLFIFPPESINHVIHISLQKILHRF